MPQARNPVDEMRAALEAIRSADGNRKPLTYAPWVLSSMLLVVLRGHAESLDAMDWLKFSGVVVVLPLLARQAMRGLDKQKRKAEATMVRLLREVRGLQDWNRLQEVTRYRGLPLGDDVQRAVVSAARAQDTRDEERRFRAEREKVLGRKEPAPAAAAEPGRDRDPVLTR